MKDETDYEWVVSTECCLDDRGYLLVPAHTLPEVEQDDYDYFWKQQQPEEDEQQASSISTASSTQDDDEDDNDTLISSSATAFQPKSILKKEGRRRPNPRQHRGVLFHEGVLVREYAVTLGDHPCNLDGLALTLDWSHAEDDMILSLQSVAPFRTRKFSMPHRLTYQERRERLFHTPMNYNFQLEQAMCTPMMTVSPNSSAPDNSALLVPVDQPNMTEATVDFDKWAKYNKRVLTPPPTEATWSRTTTSESETSASLPEPPEQTADIHHVEK